MLSDVIWISVRMNELDDHTSITSADSQITWVTSYKQLPAGNSTGGTAVSATAVSAGVIKFILCI